MSELTQEQVLGMSVQELAEATAVHVMGWTEGDHPEVNGTGQWMAEYEFPVYFRQDGSFVLSERWNPAEDIETAWEVVEKLDEEVIVKKYKAIGGIKYWCKVGETILEVADTVPLAICRAALLTTIQEGR